MGAYGTSPYSTRTNRLGLQGWGYKVFYMGLDKLERKNIKLGELGGKEDLQDVGKWERIWTKYIV